MSIGVCINRSDSDLSELQDKEGDHATSDCLDGCLFREIAHYARIERQLRDQGKSRHVPWEEWDRLSPGIKRELYTQRGLDGEASR